MRDRTSKVEAVRSSFWIFRLDKNQWIRVQDQGPETDRALHAASASIPMEDREPKPRYAHQMVYDPVRRYFFLFGGNLGTADGERLDDFWKLELVRCVWF